MSRLSRPIEDLKPHYTVVVVGSGYGGGIAASRLARAGQSVCVLERGKEFQLGEYPDTPEEAVEESQVDAPEGHVGSRTGLFDSRLNPDMNVFVGCGLGGTSLVNANVSLRAEPRVFEDARWPAAVRADLGTRVEQGYARAEEMLKPVRYPDHHPRLPKLEALEASAKALGGRFYRPPINVHFGPQGPNHVGVEQSPCTLCGDCCSGCNGGAKNTVVMNYLPDAVNHGADIFTRVSVRHLEREGGRWLVHFQLLDSGREAFDAPTLFVSADVVVLGAGTLGSTEILLRSRLRGLELSDQLGHRFTGNGDVLAFAYNTDRRIDGIGLGTRPPDPDRPVGPCITGIIDLRDPQKALTDGMVIEEGSIPGALAPALAPAFSKAAALQFAEGNGGLGAMVRRKARELESLIRGAYSGAVNHTQTYLVMAHDDGNGRMFLDDDRLRIDWPSVGSQKVFEKVSDALRASTGPLGGQYLTNPIWTKLFHHHLVTVHPLGGCVMGDDAQGGVVDHKGRVFSAAVGGEVHPGLYVSDGAVVPLPLGVNPLLTISALAERCVALLAEDRGWTIDYTLPSAPRAQAAPAAAPRMGVQFTETMRGHFSTAVTDDYRRGAERGRADGSPFEFTLTVASDDLEGMLADDAHPARMVGTVKAPALSVEPLTVSSGAFNLFVRDPESVGTRRMLYRMKLTSEEGRTWSFSGFKVIHDGAGFDLWSDTTTLYITVYDGPDESKPLGKGVLTISASDFTKQMRTMQVTNAPNLGARLKALARFGGFFAGTLFQTYGGVFAHKTEFDPEAPPRKKRELRAGPAELHPFVTSDGVHLGLARYRGGSRGPVILSPGLGVSSRIFSIDTTETNLLEFLYAHEYDVWLFDYRSSIELPSALRPSTADQVATIDYPEAVQRVLAVTGAPSVQMVAHCFGSTTFFMAMLAGLQGVRSAVCSQIATDIEAVRLTKIKSGLHVPEVLERLGVKSMTAYSDTHADWKSRLFDDALRLYPLDQDEHCQSPVCHRITFLYSLLYEHSQLNQATHDALHELFGVANIQSLEHLALLVRMKHLVDAQGRDVYMPHLDRLAIPLAFIHGAENQCFLPVSTEKTYERLRKANGPELYSRQVIPGYGHIDCIYGKNAARDVYPYILRHLDPTSRA